MAGGSRERQDATVERERRLAEALRANLKRRKAQQRKRAVEAAPDPDKVERDGG